MAHAVRTRAALLLALPAILALTLLPGPGASGAAKQAAFTVVAGQGGANGGLNFNGTSKGKLIITVPLGAAVQITLTNKGDLPHSLQIIPYTATPPSTAAAKPAFPGAETPNPQTGVNKGQSAVAKFTASKPGKYLFICGFPGHALLGMYGVFEVSSSASTAPSMTTAK
jgi:sulfocyanin